MAWRRTGSLPRSFLNAARSPATIRPSPSANATAFRRAASPLPTPRRISFTLPRSVEALGCVQSMMPLHSVMAATRLTSHVAVDARACCELSQGTLTFTRTCPDR